MHVESNNAHTQAHKLRGVIANLDGQIRDAERTIANADAAGKQIALHVLLGRATQADQEKHRNDVAQARDALSDRRAVRDAAREELRRLEAAETAEKRAAAEVEARKLVQERVAAARRFDAAAREMQAAYADFARLGHEIPSTGVEFRVPPGSMAQWESITGHHRIDGAMPALVDVLHPHLIRARRIPSLADSEAALWRALLGE